MTERLTILVEEKGTRIVKRGLRSLGKESKDAGNNVELLKTALKGIAVAGAVAALTAAAGAAIELKDALAEVSTLLGDTPGEMQMLEEASKRLAVEFGSLPVEQARGFYQAISAGASDAAEATEILTAANKLAVGGVTDVFTATDGLTTVLNAYGDQVESATAVSDALFVGMRAGKTTIEELSSSLGKVAPLAAQAGVGFDELVAATSALTKGGISTREAVTGVRAVLAAVVKPTSEAADLAKELGIEFNAAALESQGFAGFMETLTKATGGSTEQLAQLFGGVEALVPVLALSGQAGEDFADILADMSDKAGATEDAFNTIADSPGFQLGRLAAAAKVELIELGNVVLPLITSAARFLADNLSTIVSVLKTLAVAFAATQAAKFVTFLGKASLGAAQLQAVLGRTTLAVGAYNAVVIRAGAATAVLNAAILANPIGLVVAGLATAVALFVRFKDEVQISANGLATLGDVASVLWDRMTDGLSSVRDLIFGVFSSATDFVRAFVEDSAAFIGGLLSKVNVDFQGISNAARKTANFSIAVFKSFIDVTIGNFKALGEAALAVFNGISRSAQLVTLGLQAAVIGEFELAGQAFGGAFDGRTFDFSAATRSAEETAAAVGQNFGRDFIGEAGAGIAAGADAVTGALDGVFDEAERRAQNRASDRGLIALANQRSTDVVTPDTNPVVPTSGTSGGGGSSKAALNDELSRENRLLKEQKQILETLRQPFADLQIRKEALTNLFEQGRISSGEFTSAMRDLNVEISSLDNSLSGGLLNGLARIAQEANNIGQQMSDFVVGSFNSATDAIVEFAKTGQFNVRQFFQDLFAQLLKLAANQLFSQLLGGFGGGGGGGLGGLLGGLLGFQNGGSAMVTGNNNSPDSQLVALRATRGERIDVSTPGQQRNGGVNGDGGTTVVQSPPVNVVAQLSSGDVVGAFDNDEGETVVINMLQRNASTVKQIAQG